MIAAQIDKLWIKNSPRINSKRVIRIILLSLVLPIVIALGLDFSLGWQPLITLIAALIFIPLSSVIVMRAILAEIDQVIQQIAPPEIKPEIKLESTNENKNELEA